MRLVPDARNAWRWFSMWAMGAALALQGAWMALPPDLVERSPDWLASAVTAALMLLGIAGRTVKQGPDE